MKKHSVLSMCKKLLAVLLLLGGTPAVANEPVSALQSESELFAGLGTVESYQPAVKQIVINGTRFQIHVSTKVGEVVSWPGEVQSRSDLSSVKAGDQVFFEAAPGKREPYRLKYIYWLIK